MGALIVWTRGVADTPHSALVARTVADCVAFGQRSSPACLNWVLSFFLISEATDLAVPAGRLSFISSVQISDSKRTLPNHHSFRFKLRTESRVNLFRRVSCL
jgi:hypothetical protein